MEDNPYIQIIGIIDSYGALDYRKLRLNDIDLMHGFYWPGIFHKRWRFIISDWGLDKFPLNKEELTPDDIDRIFATMRKIVEPPIWFLEGEIWEELGRPRKGKKYILYKKKCNELRKQKGICQKQ